MYAVSNLIICFISTFVTFNSVFCYIYMTAHFFMFYAINQFQIKFSNCLHKDTSWKEPFPITMYSFGLVCIGFNAITMVTSKAIFNCSPCTFSCSHGLLSPVYKIIFPNHQLLSETEVKGYTQCKRSFINIRILTQYCRHPLQCKANVFMIKHYYLVI